MRRAIYTYKDTDWIRGIWETLNEDFEDLDLILCKNNEMTLLEGDFIKDRYEIAIRFGTFASYTPPTDFEYNIKEGIKKCSNKLKARQIFMKNKIPTPPVYSLAEIKGMIFNDDYEGINDILPLVARKERHHGGRGFKLLEDVNEVSTAIREGLDFDIGYFSEFYPKQEEYRVHIASGKAIIVARKEVPEEQQSQPVWNLNDNGVCEGFNTLRWSDYRQIEDIIKSASLAVNILGLDFGAVDVVARPESGAFAPAGVLEVNSAPRLEEYGIKRYSQYFKWLFLHETKKAEYKFPHELDRFSFTNDDFEEEYYRFLNRGSHTGEERQTLFDDFWVG